MQDSDARKPGSITSPLFAAIMLGSGSTSMMLSERILPRCLPQMFMRGSPREGAQDGDQVLAVGVRQLQGLHLCVQPGMGVAAAPGELDHLLQRAEAAVVHVRRGGGGPAQGGRL